MYQHKVKSIFQKNCFPGFSKYHMNYGGLFVGHSIKTGLWMLTREKERHDVNKGGLESDG